MNSIKFLLILFVSNAYATLPNLRFSKCQLSTEKSKLLKTSIELKEKTKNSEVFHKVANYCNGRCRKDIYKASSLCVDVNGDSDICSYCCVLNESENRCNILNEMSYKHVIICARDVNSVVRYEMATNFETFTNEVVDDQDENHIDPIAFFHSKSFSKFNKIHRQKFMNDNDSSSLEKNRMFKGKAIN